MSGSEGDHSGMPQEKTPDQAYESSEAVEVCRDDMDQPLLLDANRLSIDIERFSCLSAEMSALLTRLWEEARRSAEQLSRVSSAIELKKKDLKAIHGIEASAEALERLTQDHRQRKESFERLYRISGFFGRQRKQNECRRIKNTRQICRSADGRRRKRTGKSGPGKAEITAAD